MKCGKRRIWRGIPWSQGLLIVTLCATTGCLETDPHAAVSGVSPVTAASDSSIMEVAQVDSVAGGVPDTLRYHRYPIDDAQSLKALQDSLGEETLARILKLNRIDHRHARRGDTLVVADSLGDFLALAPFPAWVERVRAVPKLLLVSRRVQAVAAYEAGRLVFWGPTSTGKRSTPTPDGLFFTNWRMQSRRSTMNADWLLKWYVNFENFRGISFHQYSLPGYPGSHACVRLGEDDARWIYEWATLWILSRDQTHILAQGTPVIVFGDYAYGQPPPWKRLATDPLATTLTLDEIDTMLREHLPALQAAVDARYAYIDSLSRHLIGLPF